MDLNTPLRTSSNEYELSHGKLTKRASKALKKKFKYIAKVDIGNTTRYFYTIAEYNAFLKGKNPSKKDDTDKTKTAKVPSAQASKKSSSESKTSDKKTRFNRMINVGRTFVEKQVKKAVKETNKKVEAEVQEKTESLKKTAEKLKKKVSTETKEAKEVLKKVEKKVKKQVPKKVEVAKKETEEAFKKIKKELQKKVEKPVSNKVEAAKKETEEVFKKIKKELQKPILKKVNATNSETESHYKVYNLNTADADAVSEKNSPKSWDELEHKDRDYTRDEDQVAVNPHHVTEDEVSKLTEAEKERIMAVQEETGVELFEYHINCQSCTLAYDLRRRGYDVEAAPYDWDETWQANYEGLTMWYEGVKLDDWTTHKVDHITDEIAKQGSEAAKEFAEKEQKELQANIMSTLDEMPDDSYGQFCVFWQYGGGHSIVWEKVKGEVTFRDCQINESYTFDQLFKENSGYDALREASILRTDDKKLTDEALKRVRNVSDTSPIEEILKEVRERIARDPELAQREQKELKKREQREKLHKTRLRSQVLNRGQLEIKE